jgi:hypothetical protein
MSSCSLTGSTNLNDSTIKEFHPNSTFPVKKLTTVIQINTLLGMFNGDLSASEVICIDMGRSGHGLF